MGERLEFVLTRDQAVRIGDVVVRNAGVKSDRGNNQVKFGLEAPKDVKILRAELVGREVETLAKWIQPDDGHPECLDKYVSDDA